MKAIDSLLDTLLIRRPTGAVFSGVRKDRSAPIIARLLMLIIAPSAQSLRGPRMCLRVAQTRLQKGDENV
jgi:hypothetical protein